MSVSGHTGPGPWATVSIVATILIAAGGLIFTGLQFVNQQKQFVQTSQQGRYNDILAGLSDPSPAAQVAAMSRLVDFVDSADNFSQPGDQQRMGKELERTLVQYIRSTADTTSGGLKAYEGLRPNWVLAATAMQQLTLLLSDPRLRAVNLQSLDISHVDLHGYAQHDLHLTANLTLDGVDLREASLGGIRVGAKAHVNLEQADLTCADLNGTDTREASLGTADLAYADLTGANLSNLDLRHTSGLTVDQIRHASWNARTLWPPALRGLPATDDDAMQPIHGLCTYLVNRMTGMVPGEGYQNTTPYPLGPRYTSVDRHALTVRLVRQSCLVAPANHHVDPQVLFDATDVSVRTLVRRCH